MYKTDIPKSTCESKRDNVAPLTEIKVDLVEIVNMWSCLQPWRTRAERVLPLSALSRRFGICLINVKWADRTYPLSALLSPPITDSSELPQLSQRDRKIQKSGPSDHYYTEKTFKISIKLCSSPSQISSRPSATWNPHKAGRETREWTPDRSDWTSLL